MHSGWYRYLSKRVLYKDLIFALYSTLLRCSRNSCRYVAPSAACPSRESSEDRGKPVVPMAGMHVGAERGNFNSSK